MKNNGNGNGQDLKVTLSLITAWIGLVIFTLGAHPDWVGLAHNNTVGVLQILFMAIGLGFLALGSYAAVRALWGNGEISIIAQIGARLIASGYVVAAASIMADVLGLGSQSWPQSAHFGPLQKYGLLLGEGIMALGIVMLYPWKRPQSPPPQNEEQG